MNQVRTRLLAGGVPADDTCWAQIVLRLPDGSRLQRRFVCDTATVADLYDWAEAEGVQSSSFRCVHAPRLHPDARR